MLDRILPVGSRSRDIVREKLLEPRIPSHIRSRFTQLDDDQLQRVKLSLQTNFFSRSKENYLSSPQGQQAMADHLHGRLSKSRKFIVPWLDDSRRLEGARILEVGCGTGSSTVALAEQGAHVTCVDIDTLALKDARERCRVYDVQAEIIESNATQLKKLFRAGSFDIVIMYATLEHMTYEERLIAMADSWDLLSQNSLWCVVDTPNRLSYFDSHTSCLPFFDWLPDDLAFDYSKFSQRETFNILFRDPNEASRLEFIRWGRGISFHEFRLAMDGADLSSVSCLSDFVKKQRLFSWLQWRFSDQFTYERLLKKLAPNIHSAFFQPSLDLLIRK